MTSALQVSAISLRHNSIHYLACRITIGLLFLLLLRTSFAPDEYYQAYEPAFKIVYPDTKIVLTWEWQAPYQLRSHALIYPYILIFTCLKSMGVTSPFLHVMLPRLYHCIVSIVADCCYYDICRRLFSSSQCAYVMTVCLFSWPILYSASRTLANTAEASYYAITLYLWFRGTYSNSSDRKWVVAAAAFSAIQGYMRPTSLINLTLPALVALVTHKRLLSLRFLLHALGTALICFLLCVLLDVTYYGTFTLPPWNFIYYNFIANMSAQFGVEPIHWYITQGLPMLLGGYVIFIPLTARYIYNNWHILPLQFRLLLVTAVLNVIVLSLSPHKEFRFLFVHLFPLHSIIGLAIHAHDHSKPHSTTAAPISATATTSIIRATAKTASGVWCVFIIAWVHMLVAGYLSYSHQAGAEAALLHAASIASSMKAAPIIHILAPCYSFPGRAFLPPHVEVSLVSPDCGMSPGNRSQSQIFDEAPLECYTSLLNSSEKSSGASWAHPDVIVTFDAYAAELQPAFDQLQMTQVAQFQHAHFRYDYDDVRIKRTAVVLVRSCQSGPSE